MDFRMSSIILVSPSPSDMYISAKDSSLHRQLTYSTVKCIQHCGVETGRNQVAVIASDIEYCQYVRLIER